MKIDQKKGRNKVDHREKKYPAKSHQTQKGEEKISRRKDKRKVTNIKYSRSN
jgi:hypothetical protein